MTITIRQGETLQLTVTANDDTAQTVRLLVQSTNGIILNLLESFTTVDGVTSAVISTNDTLFDVGEYEYMLEVTYADGTIEKLPDVSDCDDGDCGLPTFRVCEAIIAEVS